MEEERMREEVWGMFYDDMWEYLLCRERYWKGRTDAVACVLRLLGVSEEEIGQEEEKLTELIEDETLSWSEKKAQKEEVKRWKK